MSLTSTVGVARTGSTSLRATIPEGIVAFLDIKAGEQLEWKMEFVDDERIVIVKKLNVNVAEALELARKYTKEGT